MSHSRYLIRFEPFQSKWKKVAPCDSVFQPMQYLTAMMTHCKTYRIVGEENRVVSTISPFKFAQNFDLLPYVAKVPSSPGAYLRIVMCPICRMKAWLFYDRPIFPIGTFLLEIVRYLWERSCLVLCHAFLMRIHAKEEAVVVWAGGVKRSGAIVFGTSGK